MALGDPWDKKAHEMCMLLCSSVKDRHKVLCPCYRTEVSFSFYIHRLLLHVLRLCFIVTYIHKTHLLLCSLIATKVHCGIRNILKRAMDLKGRLQQAKEVFGTALKEQLPID